MVIRATETNNAEKWKRQVTIQVPRLGTVLFCQNKVIVESVVEISG